MSRILCQIIMKHNAQDSLNIPNKLVHFVHTRKRVFLFILLNIEQIRNKEHQAEYYRNNEVNIPGYVYVQVAMHVIRNIGA
jgi:hypothetical protein